MKYKVKKTIYVSQALSLAEDRGTNDKSNSHIGTIPSPPPYTFHTCYFDIRILSCFKKMYDYYNSPSPALGPPPKYLGLVVELKHLTMAHTHLMVFSFVIVPAVPRSLFTSIAWNRYIIQMGGLDMSSY